MSDVNDFDYEDDDQPEQSDRNPLRARMKQLEKDIAAKDKALAEALEAKRELAFVKAGISPADPKFKYFVKGYDGELNPDAIKQAAIEAQFLSPENAPSQDETKGWRTSDEVAAGTHTATPPPDIAQRIARAKSEREIMDILAEAQASQ